MRSRRALLGQPGGSWGLAGCTAPARGVVPWSWLVTPRELGETHYEFLSLRPGTLLRAERVPRDVQLSLRANVGVRLSGEFGIEFAAVDGFTFYAADGGTSGGHGVVRGGVVADAVADTVAGKGYTPEGSYAGFDALAAEIEGGVLVTGRTHEPTDDGLVEGGARWRLGRVHSTVTRASVFADAAAARGGRPP